MKVSTHKWLLILLMVIGITLQFTLTSCKSDKTAATTSQAVSLEILEIFKVEMDEESRKPTTLSYKDVKHSRDGKIFRQDFYDVDNTLKGVELLTREGAKGISNYYAPDSTLLSIYHLEYEGDKMTKKSGYDGQSNALLRTEVYTYNATTGHKTGKDLYDESGKLVRKIKMKQDAYGNDILVEVVSSSNQMIGQESFEITKKDNANRWLEKWGSTSGVTTTFHRRTFK